LGGDGVALRNATVAGDATVPKGIQLSSGTANATVRNATVRDVRIGVQLRGTRNATVENVTVRNASVAGIGVEPEWSRVRPVIPARNTTLVGVAVRNGSGPAISVSDAPDTSLRRIDVGGAELSLSASNVTIAPASDPPSPPSGNDTVAPPVEIDPAGEGPLNVTLHYDERDAEGIVESTLAAYGYSIEGIEALGDEPRDGPGGVLGLRAAAAETPEWQPLGASSPDPDANQVHVAATEPRAIAAIGRIAPAFEPTIEATTAPVVAGEALRVNVSVANPGNVSVTRELSLSVDGTVRDSRNVTLSGGENATIGMTWETAPGDAGEHAIAVAGRNDSDSGTVSVLEPANLTVAVASTNAPVVAGGNLTVDVTITNAGEVPGRETVALAIDGTERDSRNVSLEVGGSTTVTLAWNTTASDAGEYTARVSSATDTDSESLIVRAPAAFAVSIDSTSAPVAAGENLLVNATVANMGGVAGTRNVTLTDVSGDETDGVSVALAAGETRNVTLDWTTSDADVGTGTVAVGVGDDTAYANVTVGPAAYVPGTVKATLNRSSTPNGTAVKLTVEAGFTNGTTLDVTSTAKVASNDTTVATVDNNAGAITTVSRGVAALIATYRGDTDSDVLRVTSGAYVTGSLDLTPVEGAVPNGTTTEALVEAAFTNGTTLDVTEAATVASNDTTVATVAGNGTVTAERRGVARLDATYRGDADAEALTVTAATYVPGTLAVTLDDTAVPNGTTTSLAVAAAFTNGTTLDVTDAVTLVSNDTGIATAAADGTLTAVGRGVANLTATYEGDADTDVVTVTPAAYIPGSLNTTLVEDVVPNGTTTEVIVEAAFTNGTTRTVTEAATVTSNDTTVATVAGNGTVTAERRGVARLRGAYRGDADSDSLSVTAATYVPGTLQATLNDAEAPNGTATSLTVTAAFTNGTTRDVTEAAILRSNDAEVATVADNGSITAVDRGVVTFTATYEGDADTDTLTVTPAAYVPGTLEATLDRSRTPNGTAVKLTVEAGFTNGTTLDVTGGADLASNDTAVATIENDTGLVSTERIGTARFTATYGGDTGSETLRVTSAAYVTGSLNVTLAEEVVPNGTTTEVVIEATFTNGTTQAVTEAATLTSNDTAVATVSENGTATAERRGVARLDATYRGDADAKALTVTAATYVPGTIRATLNDAEIPNGTTTSIAVTAAFTNGTTRDVTEAAILRSNDTGVVTIADDGTVAAATKGVTRLTATFGGDADAAVLGVGPAAYVGGSLNVTLAASRIPNGTTTTLTVEAAFTNGTIREVTTAATVYATETAIATVRGRTVSGVREGTVDVRAEYGGDTAADELTVSPAAYVAGSLNLSVADASIPNGTATTVTVRAEFTNGTTRDVTGAATTYSNDTTVATVSGRTITAASDGTVEIAADYGGDTVSVGLIVGPAAYVPDSLTVTLADSIVANGTTTTVTVEATFTNGTTRAVTGAATLSSNATAVASVSDGGTVTVAREGSTTIEAEYGNDTSVATLTVEPAVYVPGTLNATPAETTVPNGTTTTLVVEAAFTNGTTRTVTSSAALASNDTSVAVVSDDGTVTAVGQGVAGLTVTFGGETASATLTVEPLEGTVTVDGTATSAEPGGNVTVTFTIENNRTAPAGFILNLTHLPEGFSIVDQSSPGGTWNAGETKWLWETIDGGESKSASVTLAVPRDANGTYAVEAAVLDADAVRDATSVAFTTCLSIAGAIDGDDDGTIGDFEVLRAIELWRTNAAVPGTCGETIDDFEMLELIETWRSGETITAN
jgi:hypothetical protein